MRHAEGSTLPDAPRAIARAATLTSFGNLSSRVIGLVREMVKSFYFGNGQAASAFELAANIPTQFYDLLIGGMLSSALVPTFSELADEDDPARRRAFGELLGAVLGLSLLVLTLVVLVLWLLALPIARFISGGPNQDPHLLAALLRLTIPAILFLNLSGILTAALHARRRFVFTAFTATTYNAVMIVCVILLESRFGVMALAGGLLAGSIAQVLIQVPGLRGVPLRLSLNWHLPGTTGGAALLASGWWITARSDRCAGQLHPRFAHQRRGASDHALRSASDPVPARHGGDGDCHSNPAGALLCTRRGI